MALHHSAAPRSLPAPKTIRHGTTEQLPLHTENDEGASYGPLTLSIGGGETLRFNSNDLEDGNADKGLSGGTGPGKGEWRLELSSDLDIEALSYIRTSDGFLTAMHDTAPAEEGRCEVAIFNPGSDANQESPLRLVNPPRCWRTARWIHEQQGSHDKHRSKESMSDHIQDVWERRWRPNSRSALPGQHAQRSDHRPRGASVEASGVDPPEGPIPGN